MSDAPIVPQTHVSEVSTTRVIFLALESQQLNFKEIYYLKEQWAINQAMDLARLFQNAIDPSNLRFDDKEACNDLKGLEGMVEGRCTPVSIEGDDINVRAIVLDLTKMLGGLLDIQFSQDQKKKFEEVIASSFTNLEKEQTDAWIFWQSEGAHKVTYNYNLLFATLQEQPEPLLIGLPIGLETTVNISKKELLGITLEDKHHFVVTAGAVKVVQRRLS